MAVSAGHMGSWNAALVQMGGLQEKKISLEKVRLGVLASVGDRKRQIDASVSHFGR